MSAIHTRKETGNTTRLTSSTQNRLLRIYTRYKVEAMANEEHIDEVTVWRGVSGEETRQVQQNA